MAELARLANLYPDGSSALIFRGMVHMQAQEPREALKEFEGYLAVTPPRTCRRSCARVWPSSDEISAAP
jgi:hypothetical protein